MPPYRQMFYQFCDLNVEEYVPAGHRGGDRGAQAQSRKPQGPKGLLPLFPFMSAVTAQGMAGPGERVLPALLWLGSCGTQQRLSGGPMGHPAPSSQPSWAQSVALGWGLCLPPVWPTQGFLT